MNHTAYINWLKERVAAGHKVTMVRTGGQYTGRQLYAREENKNGRIYKWWYDPTADGKEIAEAAGIGYEEQKIAKE